MTASSKAPRRLGGSDLSVFPVGLGLMSLSGAYGKSDDAAGIGVIHHAIDRGVTFLDSSDMYGWGHNETLLGKALAGGRRSRVVLATKFGQVQRPGGANGVDGSPAHVKAACDASLKRLGVDVIDLYYQHRVDPAVPIEETVGAMAGLVKAGKVRALGLSEAAPETIRRAHKVHPIAAVQSEYSLLYRRDAEETIATTRALGISYVAYAPLGRSLLTGSVRQASDIPEGDGRGRSQRERPRVGPAVGHDQGHAQQLLVGPHPLGHLPHLRGNDGQLSRPDAAGGKLRLGGRNRPLSRAGRAHQAHRARPVRP